VLIAAPRAGGVHDEISGAAPPRATLLRVEGPFGNAMLARQAPHAVKRALSAGTRAGRRVRAVAERWRSDRESVGAQAGTGHAMKGTRGERNRSISSGERLVVARPAGSPLFPDLARIEQPKHRQPKILRGSAHSIAQLLDRTARRLDYLVVETRR